MDDAGGCGGGEKVIHIDCDSVLFGHGNGKLEASVVIKGPRENLVYEIYFILKQIEDRCPGPYADALEKIMKEAGCNVSDTQ